LYLSELGTVPELPEAETIARELNRRLSGGTFGRVLLRRKDIVHGDPRPLSRLLSGRRVQRVHRRAKRVVLDLEPASQLVFHLGMSGRLSVVPIDTPRERHTHLRVAIVDRGVELRFRDTRRFGGVWCFAGPLAEGRHVGRRLGELGPEPLDLTPLPFGRILERKRQIKALLLDQQAIAGLGNIYCDEALHAARIHPLARADTLGRVESVRLLRAIKTTLNKAIRFNGSTLVDYRTTDGTAGSFQLHHRVYQRAGKPCKRCGTLIERINAAGRSTFLCPACQVDPGRT
jgi:formamidopyrimidine-DNA glycosylase